ncbi:MAG: sugar ABC transporter substrate-binding protein [Burkholderiaceae bacterium]
MTAPATRRSGAPRLTRRAWLGGAAAAALAGCARGDAQTVRFWAMGREGEVVAELLTAFEREHPGVRVRVEQLPWTAAHEKLLTAFAGDALPDVAQLGNTWLPEFVALGALAPLDERIAAAADIDAADYFGGIWDTNRVDGRLYGLPWYVDTRVLFYRRDIAAAAGVEQPPRDWAQWLLALRAVKRHVGAERFAMLLPLNEYDPLVALALQQGGAEALVRDGGRYGNFRGEAFRRAWGFYLSLFDQQLAPPASDNEIANLYHEFARGYFTYYIGGPWQIGEFRRRLPPQLQASWATAPLPGPDGPGASTAGGSSLAIFARSPRKQAAWALMRYLSRPAVQQRFYALSGNLPPRRSAWADAALAGDAPVRAFADQLERARPVPQVPEWERIATELKLTADRVVRGTLERDQALALLDARCDAMLDKRRWMLQRRAA